VATHLISNSGVAGFPAMFEDRGDKSTQMSDQQITSFALNSKYLGTSVSSPLTYCATHSD
jgi:hypothetical protein